MRVLIFFVLIFIHAKSVGQTRLNYLNYHRSILKAEELFFVHAFDSSIKMYHKIFIAYPKPFAEDCYIALQFAALRKDTASVDFFLRKAAENGVNWETLLLSKHVRSLFMNISYKKAMAIVYDRGRQKYLTEINVPLRDSITHLILNDFRARGYINVAVKNNTLKKDSNGMYQIYGRHPLRLDTNLAILTKIVADFGWPGQHLIGIADEELDHMKGFGLLESITNLILYHHTCGLYLLDKSLLDAIKGGELLPAEYALIYEWAYDDFYQSKGQFRGGNTIYHFNIKCEYPPQKKFYNNFLNSFFYCHDTALVNSCRREIGMETLQHAKLKDDFATRNDMILRFGFSGRY